MKRLFKQIISIFRQMPSTVAAPVSAPATGNSLLWAAAKGDLLLFLQNDSFAGSAETCRTAVAEALSIPLARRPLRFTFEASQAGDAAYRLILAFQPAASLSASQLARGEFHPRPPGDGLSLLLVFAHEQEAMTWVEGRVGGDASPDNPAFATLLQQSFRDLLSHLPA